MLKQWRLEIEEAPDPSPTLIDKIYSQATQRIIKVASESNQNDHCFLEAHVIAQFLTKNEGIAQLLDA